METYGELVDFLRDPKPEVRQQAAQLVLGLTKATDAVAYFRRRESNAIRYLKALCLDDPVRVSWRIFY
jgi:HEAT repeat protein